MAVTTQAVTKALVDYVHDLRYEQIPPEVIERAKMLLLDFLGVALGGLRVAESTAPILAGIADLAEGAAGTSTVVGRGETLPAHYAALANATLAHSMDFDDTHREAIIHIGTPLFATLLALAERYGASGRDFLTAAVAGYDVIGKLGKAHGGLVHARGFHPTATTGVFGATAAGGRLTGLSREETTNALGLNVSQAAGSVQFLANGSWNKRFHTGLAAHNAVIALVMARHGYFGSSEPLEGRDGYFALYAGGDADPSAALAGLGAEYEVMATAVKPYPCCRYSHAAIDAVIDIVRTEALVREQVASIAVEIGETGYALVADPPAQKRVPANVVEGQFSLFFAAATAASGGYDWASYDTLPDPAVRDLMGRIDVRCDPATGAGMGTRVSLTTADGRTFERDVPYPKGEPENPMSWDEMKDKFLEWSSAVLGPERSERVMAQVAALESVGSMAEVTESLRP